MKTLWLIITVLLALPLCAEERQLTQASYGHMLTNINVWSPDNRWVVYDVRDRDNVFDGVRIEQVNVETGAVQVLYTAQNGAACGVATYHPREPKVIFILGPEHPDREWAYGATRRRGVIVDVRAPGTWRPLDAMNYAPPFTPGALRGGSHVHVFSPDGGAVSFTYEDEVLARLGLAGDHDLNQRNVGVAVRRDGRPVTVARTHPRNHDGDYFSVLATHTVNRPRPGSDEISRAYEEGWVARPDGGRALAFLGNVATRDGREHAEVCLVELPRDMGAAADAAVAGTAIRRPAPPHGTVQRRLTFTSERRFPGVATTPRHWVRASPDGAQIAFLMKDDAGVVQLWTVSPAGGAPRQVSRNSVDIASCFTWTPDGRQIAHVMDGSVCVTDLATGHTQRLTPRRTGSDAPEPFACVVAPNGRQIAYTRRVTANGERADHAQIFIVNLPAP